MDIKAHYEIQDFGRNLKCSSKFAISFPEFQNFNPNSRVSPKSKIFVEFSIDFALPAKFEFRLEGLGGGALQLKLFWLGRVCGAEPPAKMGKNLKINNLESFRYMGFYVPGPNDAITRSLYERFWAVSLVSRPTRLSANYPYVQN